MRADVAADLSLSPFEPGAKSWNASGDNPKLDLEKAPIPIIDAAIGVVFGDRLEVENGADNATCAGSEMLCQCAYNVAKSADGVCTLRPTPSA